MIKRVVSRLDIALDLMSKIPGRGASALLTLFDFAVAAKKKKIIGYKNLIRIYVDILVDVEILSELEGRFLKTYFKQEIKFARRVGVRQSKFREAFINDGRSDESGAP